MNKAIVVVVALALSACATRTVTKEVPVTVNIPVVQECVENRPEKPTPLEQQVATLNLDWENDMDIKQKSAALGKWALDWADYGQALNAATAGCK